MTLKEMLESYDKLSASHTYALGFTHAKKLFVIKLTLEELSKYCKLDRASSSKGGFAKVRIKLHKEDRASLASKAEEIGNAELLTEDPKHNKGENLEKILTERWTGRVWKKDSTPFCIAGDITVNGEQIQIKLDCAELTNEKILTKLAT